jgi:hypothetical protein
MRLAATLVHALPGVQLRLRLADGSGVDVARQPAPDATDVVPACAFREAVVRAYDAERRDGVTPDDETPSIDVCVASGGCTHDGAIVRVPFDRVEVHAFATTLSPDACCRIFAGRPGVGDDRVVHLHHDRGTACTVVHVQSTPRERADVVALLDDLFAACVTEELVSELVST